MNILMIKIESEHDQCREKIWTTHVYATEDEPVQVLRGIYQTLLIARFSVIEGRKRIDSCSIVFCDA